MNRIFINSELSAGEQFELDSELSHHLRDVLRLSEGKQLIAVSGLNAVESLAVVSSCQPKKPVLIKIISILNQTPARQVLGSLICALPKGSHPDQICEQVAQFGVERIIFWQAARSVAKLQNETVKIERWKKIVEASARQSHGAVIPEVLCFTSTEKLIDWLKQFDFAGKDLLAVCSLSEKAIKMKELAAPDNQVHLIIGPEGDFTPQEEELFYNLGAKPVSLGNQVLRVETAAVAAVAAVSVLW